MLMKRRRSGFDLTLWCLLTLWVFFGGLELAEQLQVIPEVAAEDQGQDLDEEALSQLASGLKSDMPSLSPPRDHSVIIAITMLTPSSAFTTVHQLKQLTWHAPPSLPLYQRLSVYRI